MPKKTKHEKLRTLGDLKELLNDLTEQELNQEIIFGLVDDSLEDSWTISGIRVLTKGEMRAPERFPSFIIPGRLILYP